MAQHENHDSEEQKPVTMNWVHVTERLAREFRLPGCFVLDSKGKEWVGVQPPKAFREYLAGLFTSKESSYFNEIRFFRYSDAKAEPGVPRFLGLMPVKLKGVPYDFLGLLYESPERLQELLRLRIMPNYTLFYLYQMIAEARVRNANQGGNKALVKALEEQRLYAARLESKVESLHNEIENVKHAEISLDQKVAQLAGLLDRQMGEYSELVNRYQDLFNDHQTLQEDYLETCVRLETRISDLEIQTIADQIKPEEDPPEGEDTEEGEAPVKKTGRVAALMDRLGQSNQALLALKSDYEKLKSTYGEITPLQVGQLKATMEEIRKQADYYKGRCEEQEEQIKQLRSQALKRRRAQGTQPE